MSTIHSNFCLSCPVTQEQLSKLPFGNVYLYYREHKELKPDDSYKERLQCQVGRLNIFVDQLAGLSSDVNRRPIQLDGLRFKNNTEEAYITLKNLVKNNYECRSLGNCLMIDINPDTQEEQLEALYNKIYSELTQNQGVLIITPDPRISTPLKLSFLSIQCLVQALTDYHTTQSSDDFSLVSLGLDITNTQITDAQLELLLPVLPVLSQLNLSHNKITQEGFQKLITATGFGNLAKIDLSSNQIQSLGDVEIHHLNQLGGDFLAPTLILTENPITNIDAIRYQNLTI